MMTAVGYSEQKDALNAFERVQGNDQHPNL